MRGHCHYIKYGKAVRILILITPNIMTSLNCKYPGLVRKVGQQLHCPNCPGISEYEAKKLLLSAYALEIIDEVKNEEFNNAIII
jgi:hypothetical protein